MAEYFQTVGFALDAVKELLTAAQRVAEAKQVVRRIADQAELIQASLRNVQDILVLMDDRLKPTMPTDQYARLQNSLIMCVSSCQRELDHTFGLYDSNGQRIKAPTIMQRLRIAAQGEKIHEDRATMDSIISQLHLSLTSVNITRGLLRTEPPEITHSPREDEASFQSAIDQVNERKQRHNEQIQRWQEQSSSGTDSMYDVARVDSVLDVNVSNEEKCLPSEVQRTLTRTATENEWSPLHQALHDSNIETMKLLLQSEPSLNGATDSKGQTALHHCANAGGIPDGFKKAEILLWHGADVNREDYSEPARTPLHLAVMATWTPEQEEMVELLVRSGAEVNIHRLPRRWIDYACLKRYRSR